LTFDRVVRRNFCPKIIVRATSQVAVIANEPPAFSTIIRTPELAAIGFFAVQGDSVPGFDQCINSV
jgi:hypothetical protein